MGNWRCFWFWHSFVYDGMRCRRVCRRCRHRQVLLKRGLWVDYRAEVDADPQGLLSRKPAPESSLEFRRLWGRNVQPRIAPRQQPGPNTNTGGNP